MLLDPQIEIWVFIPIMLVMILVGLLRNYGTKLLHSNPELDYLTLRESLALMKSRLLRQTKILPPAQFEIRKQHLIKSFTDKEYLKVKDFEGTTANPMADPKQMEQTMGMMKKNIAMFIPQTVIMSWISFFFSGFVLTRLPFPLTLRFKEMVQRGIDTSDMDVTWVSSLSWYFLNLFGLTSVYTILLGTTQGSSANGSMDMMVMQQMGQANPMQQPSEVAKQFENEREYLDLAVYEFGLQGIEDRIIEMYSANDLIDKKTR